MPERPRRPDLAERFSLHPMEAEEALRCLLGAEASPPPEDDPEDESEEL